MKKKSFSKKNKKNKDEIKIDVTKEVGTINGFAIIEKFEDKKEKENEKKYKEIETKGKIVDFGNLDDKNKSFFKNWIIYDNPNESRFTKLFKELEEDKNKKNEINYNESENLDDNQEDLNSNIYDHISSNPSENNSRDSKGSRELNNDWNFNFNSKEDNFPIFENSQNNEKKRRSRKGR